MKKQILFTLTIAALAIASCKKDASVQLDKTMKTSAADIDVAGKTKVTVSGAITTNTTWTSGNYYELDQVVAVTNGATLTIEAGTIITGKKVVSPNKPGALVITRGSKITAVGTETNPIVFTSYAKVDNLLSTNPASGDFGGLVLLGSAPTNVATSTLIEGITGTDAGWSGAFGGSTSADDSGKLQYVRVEYAGYEYTTGNELNSFSFGGVGSGTTLDHLEAYYGKDDGFEFFGGTVNASYILAYACEDDALDFDNGYVGTIDHAIVMTDVAATHSKKSGQTIDGVSNTYDSNGIEVDNDANGSTNTPITKPILNYITIVGAKTNDSWNNTSVSGGGLLFAARFRRNCDFDMQNSIIMGYPKAIRVEGLTGRKLIGDDSVKVVNNVSTTQKVQKTARTSFFYNNYVQSFVGALSYASGSNDVAGQTPLAASVTSSYLSTSRFWTPAATAKASNVIDENNTTNSNINGTSGFNVFVNPFVNSFARVDLTFPAAAARASKSTIGAINSGTAKTAWGKNWMIGVYGF